ncbi:MAG: hypothetical protein KKB62_02490 [Nanoarchaeota archaeon]|nr:hypothetical protein [Nanoarchaeota archaeon]
MTHEKSELELLLIKNASTGDLTHEENRRARELIDNPVYSEKDCWLCAMMGSGNGEYQVDKAIYDIGVCQGHARYTLATAK